MRKDEATIRAEVQAEYWRRMIWAEERAKNSPHRKVWIRRRLDAGERIVEGVPKEQKVVFIEIQDGYEEGPHVQVRRLDPGVELVIVDHESGWGGVRRCARHEKQLVEEKVRFPGGRRKGGTRLAGSHGQPKE